MKRTLIDNSAHEPFSGCGQAPRPAARRSTAAAPIFVDGVPIAESAIAAEAQNHTADSAAEARAAAARALVVRHLLLRRAHELGLSPAPIRDAQGRVETAEEALVRQVLECEAPGQAPGEGERRRVYETSKARFAAPELYEASHILIEPETDDGPGWEAARQRARTLIAQLRAGAAFSELARAHSSCPTAVEGGALGQLTRGDLAPAIERALLALEPGSIAAEPVRTRHGWHIVRLERHAPAHILPFEAVADAIGATLRRRSAMAAAARYVERLAAQARIEGLQLIAMGQGDG